MQHMKQLAAVSAVGASLVCASVLAESLEKAWETEAEFKQPESVIYDSQRQILYISNINGDGTAVDGNGFISKVALDGTVEQLEWVTELNGPKGMALSGDKLYVADITELVEIDIEQGTVSNRFAAANAKFLNDVAADESGNIYVSGTMTNTVYRLSGGELGAWLQDEMLENPNGLHTEGDKLIVGSWGKMTDGFKTDVPGHLKTVSLQDGSIESLGDGKSQGNLDGVESDGKGNYLVTDWMAGKLMHIKPSGETQTVATLEQGSADHEVVADQGLVIIPMMMNDKVVAYKMAE